MGARIGRACAGLASLAAMAALGVSSPASAQCAGPTQRFTPILVNQSIGQTNFMLTPRGAFGETLSVESSTQYIAQYESWLRGEAMAPSFELEPGQTLGDEFKPLIGDGVITRADLLSPELILAASNSFFEGLRNSDIISRVVGGNDGVPIDLLPGSPNRPPPLQIPSQPNPGTNERVVTVNAQDGVVAITFGETGFCNGVHIGGGRFLTNLHCTLAPGPHRILFGNVAWNPNVGKLEGELNCVARPRWPEASASPQLDVAVLTISAGAAPPTEFNASRFSAVHFRPAMRDVWTLPQPQPLIVIQVYPPHPGNTTRLQHRVEDGSWERSRCSTAPPHPDENRVARFCVPTQPRPEIRNVGRGHGCDTIEGSSGAPLFIAAAGGGLELVGLHRMGGGPGEDSDPTNQNWNCAIPTGAFAASLPTN